MTVINHETGEIKDSTGLVPVENVAALNTLDPQAREVAVTQMLNEARSWLAHAVEATEPQSVAHFKAFIATVAESTKQLNLSKEIQLDALEMVRRAERGVGVAIRKGQADGTVAKRGDIGGGGEPGVRGGVSGSPRNVDLARPKDIVGVKYPSELTAMYDLADGVSDEQFDAVIQEAKDEGNLSHANVVRKVKGKASDLTTRKQRADKVVELADQGHSSRQIAKLIGIGEKGLADIVRDFEIQVPADKAMKRTRRHDSNRIAQETVNALQGLVMGVELINYDDLDVGEACHWATSLSESFRALNRFHKEIKEMTK